LAYIRTIETRNGGMQEKVVEPVLPVRVNYELPQPDPESRLNTFFKDNGPPPPTVVRDPHHLVMDNGWKGCECSHSRPAQLSLIVSFK
jgi:hypothetical protein